MYTYNYYKNYFTFYKKNYINYLHYTIMIFFPPKYKNGKPRAKFIIK